jgi:prepilin-type N-terminal cleavage/methylation domain-containing protein
LRSSHAFLGRAGFTLVELLMTISIIAILASLLLGGLYSSQEGARVAKTQATIAKLNNLIMHRYEAFRTRRVPISFVTTGTGGTKNIETLAGWRVDAIRELMRMELPDHWADVVYTDGTQAFPAGYPSGSAKYQTVGGRPNVIPTSLANAYFRKFNAITTANTSAGITPASPAVTSNTHSPSTVNESAECLYLIATTGMSDEMDERDLFKANEIGDTDKDGAPEFIDGWGTAISFLRWAPGFVSELQPGLLGTLADQFDPQHVYPSSNYASTANQTQPTFALYPLIFSAGPDKAYGIITKLGTPYVYASANNNPFVGYGDTTNFPDGQFGNRYDTAGTYGANGLTQESIDNIHNHLMGTK